MNDEANHRERTISDRIERLRSRIKDQQRKTRSPDDDIRVLTSAYLGLLDLLGDEL